MALFQMISAWGVPPARVRLVHFEREVMAAQLQAVGDEIGVRFCPGAASMLLTGLDPGEVVVLRGSVRTELQVVLWQEGAGPCAREAGAVDVDVHERARDGRVIPLAEGDLADSVGPCSVHLPPLAVLVFCQAGPLARLLRRRGGHVSMKWIARACWTKRCEPSRVHGRSF